MIHTIKCLPLHPLPSSGEKITSWIDTLAKVNLTHFFVLIMYIKKLMRGSNLVNTLSDLTGHSIEQISKLNSDLNSKFWKNPNQCPVQECDYKAKYRYRLIEHIAIIHDIGVIWHECPHCDYKAKQKPNLKSHLAYKHDIGVRWYGCPHCEYKAKQKFLFNRK